MSQATEFFNKLVKSKPARVALLFTSSIVPVAIAGCGAGTIEQAVGKATPTPAATITADSATNPKFATIGNADLNKTLVMHCSTTNDSIGKSPQDSDPTYKIGDKIPLFATGSTTDKCSAVDSADPYDGDAASITTATFTPTVITPPLQSPPVAITPAAGLYPVKTLAVGFVPGEAGEVVHCTTDGSAPNDNSPDCTNGITLAPTQFPSTTEVREIGKTAGKTDSVETDAIFTLDPVTTPTCTTTTQVESVHALEIAKLLANVMADPNSKVVTINNIEFVQGDFSAVVAYLNTNVYAGSGVSIDNTDITSATGAPKSGYSYRLDPGKQPDGTQNGTFNFITPPVASVPNIKTGTLEQTGANGAIYFSSTGWRDGVQSIDPATCKPEPIEIAAGFFVWDGSENSGRYFMLGQTDQSGAVLRPAGSTTPNAVVTTVEPQFNKWFGSYTNPQGASVYYDESKYYSNGESLPAYLAKNNAPLFAIPSGAEKMLASGVAEIIPSSNGKQLTVHTKDGDYFVAELVKTTGLGVSASQNDVPAAAEPKPRGAAFKTANDNKLMASVDQAEVLGKTPAALKGFAMVGMFGRYGM